MEQFFAKYYFGRPFEPFGTPHLIVLGIIAAVNFILIALRHKFNPRLRQYFSCFLATLLILSQLAWIAWVMAIGEGSIHNLLPLHLCTLFTFLSAIILVTKSSSLYEFAYFLGTGGAFYALLTPDLGLYGFPHFLFFQTMTVHGSLLTAQIYMTAVERFRPNRRSPFLVFIGTNLYMLFVGIVDTLTGSNYLFLAHKPEIPTLLDYLGPYPWYILGLEAALLATCLLLYLPFAIQNWSGNSLKTQKAI